MAPRKTAIKPSRATADWRVSRRDERAYSIHTDSSNG